MLDALSQQNLHMFVMTLWCIWKQINEKLLNDAEICPRLAVQVTHDTLLQC